MGKRSLLPNRRGKAVSFIFPMLIFLGLASCSSVEEGPLRDPDWITTRKVYGVSLGMEMSEAIGIVKQHAGNTTSPMPITPYLPWTRVIDASKLKRTGLGPSDLSFLRSDNVHKGEYGPNMAIYGTTINGKTRVTGIDLTIDQIVNIDRLGKPTALGYDVLNSTAIPIFAAEHGLNDLIRINAINGCANLYSSNFPLKSIKETMKFMKCNDSNPPDKPYITINFVIKSGLTKIQLRNPTGLSIFPGRN